MLLSLLSEFSAVYKRLNIDNLVDRGESFYQEMMADVVNELEQKGGNYCGVAYCCVHVSG